MIVSFSCIQQYFIICQHYSIRIKISSAQTFQYIFSDTINYNNLIRQIKKNTFESVLMTWIKLEPIIQSEVSQKEKHQYSILMQIYGIQKDGMMTLYARQQKRHRCKEQNFGLCGRRRGWDDLKEQHCILSYVEQTASPGSMLDTGCLGLVH